MQRPRLRLTVRRMMVLVLILGGGLGWLAYRARVQRQAIAAIEKGGGKAYFDWEVKTYNGPYAPSLTAIAGARPKWSGRLVKFVGPEYFGSIKYVIVGPKDADRVMEHVGRLSRLEQLYFSQGSDVTDAGMANIDGLTHLRSVMVGGTPKVSGAFLARLAGAGELQRLIVHGIALSDADIIPLSRLTSLMELEMTDTKMTDTGLATLTNLVRLKSLNFNHSRITGRGLAHLSGMTRLQRLILGWTRVDDLGPIGHLADLNQLMLAECPIGDSGLATVKNFSKMRKLELTSTKITDDGLSTLRKAMPLTTVSH